jgi:hypothetical protein
MILFFILLNLAVIFDAAGDALMKKGKWILSKTFQMLMILSFAGLIILAQYLPFKVIQWPTWLYFVLMYGFIRVGLFNATWGLICVNRWWYLGNTSLWDKAIRWVITKGGFPDRHFLFWIYFISWVISIGVLINGFYLIR